MDEWTSGYVADVDYLYSYFGELNPVYTQLALVEAGLQCPEFKTACELGYGQGVSLNLHAAASGIQWYGTDFNPSQAAFAQELATASGSGALVYDQAFDEFCPRTDLPDFDYIAVHGIWSWISDANRKVIVDFVRRKLKVGGVLYISYNTPAGWATTIPLRELLADHVRLLGSPGQSVVPRIDDALAFAEKLLAANPGYAKTYPQVGERIKQMKEESRNYLAHEYFNRDWVPMSFSRMSEWLAPTKASFGCSATALEHVAAINLNSEQQALLGGIANAVFRETVRDICVNQQFRRDFWVKGPRRMDNVHQAQTLRALRVILTKPRADVALVLKTPQAETRINESIYGPILDVLADHQPKTLAEIEQAIKAKGINLTQLQRAVMVLAGKGDLLPVQGDVQIAAAKPAVKRLNDHLLRASRFDDQVNYLASPVTGGGVRLDRLHRLFLLARTEGHREPDGWAGLAMEALSAQGQRIVRNGKTVDSDDEMRLHLASMARGFAEKRLPILTALGVA